MENSRVFEDAFMDIQTDMVRLCVELAEDKHPDKIFLYGSIEGRMVSFNALYLLGSELLSASKLTDDSEMVNQFLRIGSGDLGRLLKTCQEYNRPVPTELKLVFDTKTSTLDTHYQYESICNEGSGLTPANVFLAWRDEIRASLVKGNDDMEQDTYLPLGSIVLLKGGAQKVLIIARALNVRNGDKTFFFDYGGVPYPEGLVSDQIAYFNKDSVGRVVFEGFRDADDENMVDNINAYLAANPDIVKGDPKNWAV